MSGELIVALIAAIASPIASIVCVAIQSRKTRAEANERAAMSETKQNEILMLCLRTSIHSVYMMYRDKGEIPDSVFNGVCAMYNQYTAVGGNCYITALFNEMKGWRKV